MCLFVLVAWLALRAGTLELELAMKETWSGTPGASASSMPSLEGQRALTSDRSPSKEEPPPKRLCILKKEVSDDTHLENSLEHMAVKVREAFETNNFYSEDVHSHRCTDTKSTLDRH